MLRQSDAFAFVEADDAYNGFLHRMFLAGVKHHDRCTSEFRFPVGAPVTPIPMAAACSIVLPEFVQRFSYTERSRYWANANTLPGTIEHQTYEEQREIIARNEREFTEMARRDTIREEMELKRAEKRRLARLYGKPGC